MDGRRRHVALLADRLPLGSGHHRLRLGECLGERIDAETVLGGGLDMRLGVGRPGQMQVQVGALGHAQQKVAQQQRL